MSFTTDSHANRSNQLENIASLPVAAQVSAKHSLSNSLRRAPMWPLWQDVNLNWTRLPKSLRYVVFVRILDRWCQIAVSKTYSFVRSFVRPTRWTTISAWLLWVLIWHPMPMLSELLMKPKSRWTVIPRLSVLVQVNQSLHVIHFTLTLTSNHRCRLSQVVRRSYCGGFRIFIKAQLPWTSIRSTCKYPSRDWEIKKKKEKDWQAFVS